MAQLKKKAVLLIGALMLLLGMGMNLQYALDDYGLAENNGVIAIWAQQTKTGDDGSGTDGDGYSCKVTLICKDRDGNVNGSVSCSGKENCERNTFSGYVQCDDKESVRCD